jgi:hypothetical protein
MKERHTTMKDLTGNIYEGPAIKTPYFKNLMDKMIEVSFAFHKCTGILEGEDRDFISVLTKDGQELISKRSIIKIVPIYTPSDDGYELGGHVMPILTNPSMSLH